MSAPQIPDLNTLRRGGPGAAARMRGRGRGVSSEVDSHRTDSASFTQNVQTQADKDAIVQRTDLDAASSRLSCVEAGYLDDPFATLMTPPGTEEAPRRLPLMNRGTYARTSAIDRLVEDFLDTAHTPQLSCGRRRQVVSLGAGSDTRFFRLRARYPNIKLIYHEIDFEENTKVKIQQIRSPAFVKTAKELCRTDLVSEEVYQVPERPKTEDYDSAYFLHAYDLRRLAGVELRVDGVYFNLPNVQPDIPTLLISECCLIYLAPEDADRVLQAIADMIRYPASLGIVIYEPIRPYDAFGKTMVANLTARGIHLQTLRKYDSLEKQSTRMEGFAAGYGHRARTMATAKGVGVMDLDFMWNSWLDKKEKDRVLGLEFMDEVEEFVLLMQHYCIAWAWREGAGEAGMPVAFARWKELPSQLGNG